MKGSGAAAFVLCLSAAASAAAEVDLFSGDQLRGLIDIRFEHADGERSFFDRGFGKARYGNDDLVATLGEAAIVWRPFLMGDLRGYLHLQAAPEQEDAIDMVEGYLTFRPTPRSPLKWSLRGGLMYPPISLEHDGLAWSTTNTITPSAINTWVGEEVKVVGVEGTMARAIAGQEWSATAGIFGFNDTSGTILSYRGWALHDFKSTLYTQLPLPQRGPLWNRIKAYQDPYTEPTRELDGRLGFYGRVEWLPSGKLALDAFYYDNVGDRVSIEDGQISWETRFGNLGLAYDFDENTRLLMQAMHGETIAGRATPLGYYIEMNFGSAYALLAHQMGAHKIAGRFDWFETDDRSFEAIDDNNEVGWALTGAYRYTLNPHADLALEAMHIDSDRPSRIDQEPETRQQQNVLQSAVRVSF